MKTTLVAALVTLTFFGLHTQTTAQFLGTADNFAVLAGSTATNTGETRLSGSLGVWPGTAVTGFPPGVVSNGSIHPGDGVAMQAQTDLTTAYNLLANEAFDEDLTGQDLGGMTLYPGVYHFDSSAFINGTLTLDGLGNPNARFDFQIGSTLITGSSAAVRVIGQGDDRNVYWQVGSSATLGGGTAFRGHILALASITLNTGATIINGSALARNGAVTMEANWINSFETPKQFSGHVDLQDYVGDITQQPIVFEFHQPGNPTVLYSTTTYLQLDGSFAYSTNTSNVGTGSYDITAKGYHWLKRALPNVAVGLSGVTGLDYTWTKSLINGDINNDNAVDIGDYAILSATYNSTPESGNWDASADINGDESVDIADYAILSYNYSQFGDD